MVIKFNKVLRFLIAFIVLIFSIVYCYLNLISVPHNKYAYTFSLGSNHGFIIYTEEFYHLPKVIQDNIVVHEQQHLEDGTIKFWKFNELERRAYEVELRQCRCSLSQFQNSDLSLKNIESKAYLESYEQEILKNIEKYSQ